MLYCQTLFWGAEGLGDECMKITFIVSSLDIFLFIMAAFEKLQLRFKDGTHFSFYKSLLKGYNVQMSLCLTLT